MTFSLIKKIRRVVLPVCLLAVLFLPLEAALAESSQSFSTVFLQVGDGTPDPEPHPVPPGGGSGIPGFMDEIIIFESYVRAGTDEAVISWSANKAVTCSLKWGSDQDLGGGIIEGTQKKREHRAHLTELTPDTDYYYQIICADGWGRRENTAINSFKTLKLVDLKAPANPSDFSAKAKDGGIELSWINPEDPDFRAVKIQRSDEFYPEGFNEGTTIYNDRGQAIVDTEVIPGTRYYYTIFSYDNAGNYSSGAISSAKAKKHGEAEPSEGGDIIDLPPAPPAPEEDKFEIAISDFSFFIANETIEYEVDGALKLLPGTLLTVKTESGKYPKVLKSIIFSLIPKTAGETGSADLAERKKEAKSYLLKIDSVQKFYTANFAVPVKIKDYEIHAYFLNYSNSKLANAESEMGIEQFGKITADVQEANGFLSKFMSKAYAAEAGENSEKPNPIFAAEIVLYQYENGEFKKWRGENFSQFNPMFSNAKGQYGFLVPDGTYLVKAKKDNYYGFTSLPFTVKSNLVNEDIRLIFYPKSNPQKYLWTILAILVLFLAYLRTKKKNKQIKKQFAYYRLNPK